MKTPFFLFFLALLCCTASSANVNPTRAGCSWLECLGGNTYMLHINIHINGTPLSSDSLFLDWSDGNTVAIAMTDNDAAYTNGGVSSVLFTAQHTFSPGYYSIIVICGRRLNGIANIVNSASTDFILLNEIVVDPNTGGNSSPGDPTPQLELEWSTGTTNVGGFYYFDLEGDSIALSRTITGTGYQMPEAVGGGAYTFISASQFHSWNPTSPGLYTVVILCEEYYFPSAGNPVIKSVATTEILIDVDNVEAIPEFATHVISLYPNPANEWLNITTNEQGTMEITDMNGRVVLNILLIPGNNIIDVSSLAEGVYCIRVDEMRAERIVIAR